MHAFHSIHTLQPILNRRHSPPSFRTLQRWSRKDRASNRCNIRSILCAAFRMRSVDVEQHVPTPLRSRFSYFIRGGTWRRQESFARWKASTVEHFHLLRRTDSRLRKEGSGSRNPCAKETRKSSFLWRNSFPRKRNQRSADSPACRWCSTRLRSIRIDHGKDHGDGITKRCWIVAKT